MKEKSIQPLCDSLQQLAIRQHICAFSLDTISLTDTALQAKARKFGRYVEWNAKDSVLTLAAEGLLWNSGLQYDYSASGDKLSRQDKIKFRLKRVKGRLWFMRYYTEIPLM